MHAAGGPEVLRFEKVKTPKPGPHDVLLKVHAATVNHTDIFHRTGQFEIRKDLPHVLGMDIAGEIAVVGDAVENWRVGEKVVCAFEELGSSINGGYAEFAVVPAAELHRIPKGLDYVTAASTGLAFTTAWAALFYAGQLKDTDRVLIHAASSGVGLAALQIASWVGAEVYAVTTPNKTESLRERGADFVLDRTSPDLVHTIQDVTNGKGIDLVIDLVAGASLQLSVEVLGERGRVVCVGALGGEEARFNVMDLILKNATIQGIYEKIKPEDYETILRLFGDCTFKSQVDSVLPLSEARRAHERIEAKMVTGKIVLVPKGNA